MKIAPILFLFANSVHTFQAPPPPPMGPPPPGLPVDGFVIFIFILGIIYGAKKRYDLTRTKTSV